MSDHLIDKLAWLHIRDKRVLGARSTGKSTWYVPGGKREPGEGDETALIREIREELSVDLVRESLAYVGAFTAQADGKPEGVLVRVTCYRADYSGDIAAAAEIEEINWIGYADKKQCSPAMKLILDWLKEKDLIE